MSHTDWQQRLSKHTDVLTELADKRIGDAIAIACARLPVQRTAGTARVEIWRKAGAWTDVALTLVALELPGWSVRRIVREDGIWHCSLSRSPNLPVELDDVVEASHDVLPLAILSAFLDARRTAHSAPAPPATCPRTSPTNCRRICCDNFS